jgi:hypothetical protein
MAGSALLRISLAHLRRRRLRRQLLGGCGRYHKYESERQNRYPDHGPPVFPGHSARRSPFRASGPSLVGKLLSHILPALSRAARIFNRSAASKCCPRDPSATLVLRTRSSHKVAERSDANVGFRSGTTRIVSLSIPKFVRARRKCLRTSESGHYPLCLRGDWVRGYISLVGDLGG